MRVIMFGTGPFALPTFRRLYGTRHQVLRLVTQPTRSPRDAPSPLRAVAAEHGTPILDPPDVNSADACAALAAAEADLLVVADYGQILTADCLAAARLGGINLHGSLLPKYRGAAPVAWAIYRGETRTGVTVIQMTRSLDAGPTLAQAALDIRPDETTAELEPRLAELGAAVVAETLDAIEQGRVQPCAQDTGQATRARRLRKSDGVIRWERSAEQVRNQVRAFEPWPRSHTWWHRPDGPPLRLIIERCAAADEPAMSEPGTVLLARGEDLLIACGQGRLALHLVQPAGKRRMRIDEFLRGYPVRAGQRFGPAADEIGRQE